MTTMTMCRRESKEASDLGWPAGFWPHMMIASDDTGRHSAAERTYYRKEAIVYNDEFAGHMYRNVLGWEIEVFND